MTHVAALIPAYGPTPEVVDLARALLATEEVAAVVVVDDGSAPETRPTFEALEALEHVTVLRHAVNLGKGMALKTGLNHALLAYPDSAGVVTVDADGQHLPADVASVARALLDHDDPAVLILGARTFARDGTPLRSWIGNQVTRGVLRGVIGMALADTQTGLRGIGKGLIPELLAIPSQRYEYELDMLIRARARGTPIVEVPIETVYLDDNASSHFDPLVDSMRIYFVILRFAGASLAAVAVEMLTFFAVWIPTQQLIVSAVAARTMAGVVNFVLVRSLVFRSRRSVLGSGLRYVTLMAALAAFSIGMIRLLHESYALPVPLAKVIAETALFFASFAVQRDLVFGGDTPQ